MQWRSSGVVGTSGFTQHPQESVAIRIASHIEELDYGETHHDVQRTDDGNNSNDVLRVMRRVGMQKECQKYPPNHVSNHFRASPEHPGGTSEHSACWHANNFEIRDSELSEE